MESVLSEIGGKQFSDFKPMLVERATAVLSPISGEMGRIMQYIPQLDKVLNDGAFKAKSIAEPILNKTFNMRICLHVIFIFQKSKLVHVTH